MASLFIAVIYLAFISLGLPDSLLGSAWPVMHTELGASLSSAGVISLIISLSTIISALFSNQLVTRIGAPLVTALSVLLTALAMLSFSFAGAFWQLCLLAVPYGLGAGAIDTTLNNYTAKHLKARHMNWLHCCWGIGASVGPYVMGFCLSGENSWRGGYLAISIVQFVLTLIMFLSLPLWKKTAEQNGTEEKEIALPPQKTLCLKGALCLFLAGLFYFAIEQLPIVWASTFFTEVYSLNSETAAFLASLFYIGITAGRLLSGFFSEKAGDKRMVRIGLFVVLAGAALIALSLPFASFLPALIGFLLVGVGCGPVFPCLIHAVPNNFGAQYSGSVIGLMMAFSYTGMTFTPLLFGELAEAVTIKLLPFGVALLALLVLLFTELMNRAVKRLQTAG